MLCQMRDVRVAEPIIFMMAFRRLVAIGECIRCFDLMISPAHFDGGNDTREFRFTMNYRLAMPVSRSSSEIAQPVPRREPEQPLTGHLVLGMHAPEASEFHWCEVLLMTGD